MRKLLLFVAIVLQTVGSAQVYNKSAVNLLKAQGKLTGNERFANPNGGTKTFKLSSNGVLSSSTCNCWIQRDSSFAVVPFNGSGGSGGPGLPPNYENDDWSTNPIPLPFNFCLYGTTYNSIYINNNGNVSIGTPYSVFTAVAFPSTQYVMIAPFWSDVDTRGIGSGFVYYKLTSNYLIVQWDSVGYYSQHVDKRNTYQLIISNGTDSILPMGTNVGFCYKDMQWSTGDASGGMNGFGGTPATVGVNKGDGVLFAQVGLFDQTGGAYDGSVGNNDGVDWLDGRSIVFDACGTSSNVPPIALDSICDTTIVYLNQNTYPQIRFLSGESSQTTTITASSLSPGFSVVSSQSGNPASISCSFAGQASNIGYNTVTFTATDNGTGTNSTVIKKVFNVLGTTAINTAEGKEGITIFPNPASQKITIDLGKDHAAKVSVKTMLGQTVMQKDISVQNNTLDISGFENGTYLLELRTADKTIKKLFIKE